MAGIVVNFGEHYARCILPLGSCGPIQTVHMPHHQETEGLLYVQFIT